jgi:hypothetical protein
MKSGYKVVNLMDEYARDGAEQEGYRLAQDAMPNVFPPYANPDGTMVAWAVMRRDPA